jgi:hypothetical protein
MTKSVEQALILGEPVPHHRGQKLFFSQITHWSNLLNLGC